MNEELYKETPLSKFMDMMRKELSPEDFNKFEKKVKGELLSKPPVVAIIGKAGVGKTTTINNLFDVEEYVIEPLKFEDKGHVGDVRRGTIKAVRKHFELKVGIGLDIIDLPGLGDDIRKDREYEAIYQEILPQSDVILYVLKADNRTLAEDERIIQNVVIPCCDKEKMIIAVNQVDLLGENEGLHWDTRVNLPDKQQEELIKNKQSDIAKQFKEELDIDIDKTICYSAFKRYNLLALLNSIVSTTPLGFIFGLLGLLPKGQFDNEMIAPEYREKVNQIRNMKL